ncbi:conserved hypothetical protein [Altererythrobacter sp. B11]|uniref:DUF3089 domain-containing protein n=1 Tax=Altererythrobacter sp. B11 TaxID=2060312 RepID=UPI000DC6F919|nr:DUF3089 domain-containing protein [Altererythrobacter sp. B11]BBC72261.1 conserved hypothetical protein [Altererythrobacter sp. B11]
MARKFLYGFAFLILIVVAALFALRIWSDRLAEIALVPTSAFVEQQALAQNAYEDPVMWFSRPGILPEKNPARWQPSTAPSASGATQAGGAPAPAPAEPQAPATPPAPAPHFAVFFVHPTSYLQRAQWNAPLDDPESQARARIFLRGMASPFAAATEIWAPRYRQATFGAFLTDAPEAQRAIDAAYRDVEQAFDYFLESVDPNEPIVLVGHSQGSLHILRLLKERIAGTPLQARVAMAYPVGWPISLEHDLPALGLPACKMADEAGCVASWVSFAEPAEPESLLRRYGASIGFDGQPRGDGPVLCVNPLTGTEGGEAPASANLGTLVPNADLTAGELVPGAVPARCDSRGLLLIGDPPELGPYVLPGNNYHVYDIPLFWANLRQDVARRLGTWTAAH